MSSRAQLLVPAPAPKPPHVLGADDPLFRLTVDQYQQMVRSGIVREDDPVELLDGLLVKTMPQNPPHRAATRAAGKVLERFSPAGYYVDTQAPILLEQSEPEPDVIVVRGASEDFVQKHPGAKDLALVVEFADSSLQGDRVLKKPLYAAAGISMYWIINLVDQQVEVFSDPSGAAQTPDYRTTRIYLLDDSISLLIDEQGVGPIPVKELIP